MKKLIFDTLLFLISITAESQIVGVPGSASLDLDNPPEYISNKKFYHGGKDYLTIGGYLKGKKHGTFLYFIKINNGVIQLAKEETYVNGKLNGWYYRNILMEGSEEGYYKKGIKDSVWTRSRNDEYEKVEYKNGVRNGIYEYIDSDLKYKIVGQLKNDKKEGIWTEIDSVFGRKYGPYKDDKKEGIWTEIDSIHGRKNVGPYKNDKKEGIWTETDSIFGRKNVGPYKNGKKEGIWTEEIYSLGGKKYVGPYKNGKKEGIWTEISSCFKDDDKDEEISIQIYPGRKYVGSYKDGKREGIWTEQNLCTGDKTVGEYKNDKKEGTWTTTTQSTSIIEEYRNGELVPTETLHEEK